jgi:hypothetical protein
MVPEKLCRFALNRAANPVPCFIVHCQVVLFATMLLDLWHDFLFAISAHLPIAGLRTHIGAEYTAGINSFSLGLNPGASDAPLLGTILNF